MLLINFLLIKEVYNIEIDTLNRTKQRDDNQMYY